MSSDSFYSEVEALIKTHEMPDVKVSREKHKEGGIFSAKREYLRVKHDELVFDICAAPFGKDFFVSWWLYETEGIMRNMLKFTKVGEYLNERASKRTFFQADEESMFRSCVHQCVLEAIEKVTKGTSVRAMSELERAYKDGGM